MRTVLSAGQLWFSRMPVEDPDGGYLLFAGFDDRARLYRSRSSRHELVYGSQGIVEIRLDRSFSSILTAVGRYDNYQGPQAPLRTIPLWTYFRKSLPSGVFEGKSF